MRRSFGKIDEGKNKSTIHLNVLYPAIIMPTGDRSIAEGSQLSLSCPVINGNPPNFTTWSRRTDQRLWNQTLYIQNVSRADDTVYSCSVITEMFPTIGSPLRVERKNSFHLNVFFQSEIIKFSVSTTSSVKIVVINRTENTSFICIAVANPPSDLSIKDPAGDIISDVSKQNTAHHTIHNASYINAGEYICTGRNNYTSGQPTSSKLILIVRTQPRPSSDDTSVQKVSTALFIDAKLQFVAWNYLDKPNETVFSWFKENVSIPDNDSKYMVHSNELQTNITIRNTTQQDLGLYKLNVQNSVGTYTHFYELKATEAFTSEATLQSGDRSGIIAGSISAVVIVVVIVGGVLFLQRRKFVFSRSKSHTSGVTDSRHVISTTKSHVSPEYTDFDASKRDINVYDKLHVPTVSAYERLDTATLGPTTYMELKDTKKLNTDASDYVNIRI
ncbi:uncharacterized protein LOC132760420 isoform X3 [Ruditapes philippinarum]|uniref:uncharacterized protein LOC132760420 isoform X3 n=1 Tax=Ruditapes philippinarum TaxID=129788 RepID=UPI00295B8737|nr:uncharacterized protein LOC132760420 isoform X3 [Ruditapes philippinarum]